MKVALLVPSLKRKGPVIVASDIATRLQGQVEQLHLLYFDQDDSQPAYAGGVECRQVSFYGKELGDYDIVHAHALRPDLYTSFRKKSLRAKTVTTVHNYVEQELLYTYNKVVSRVFSRVWTSAWRNKDAVVFLSNHMRSYYEANFNIRGGHVIHNGRSTAGNTIELDTSDVNVAKLRNLKNNYVVCGLCAMLTARKNAMELLELVRASPKLAACIVGDGPEMANLKAYAAQNQIEDRCIFAGFQSNIEAWMRAFDCYVMCSFSEGFPLVMLEAGAMDTPILCIDSPLFRELFTANEVRFYTSRNFEDMAKGVFEIMADRSGYAQRLKAAVAHRYSVDIMANSYLQLYMSLRS
jgi:glycosyltransferase involved in cell wall biosynthesis